jgi:hypothetical protein
VSLGLELILFWGVNNFYPCIFLINARCARFQRTKELEEKILQQKLIAQKSKMEISTEESKEFAKPVEVIVDELKAEEKENVSNVTVVKPEEEDPKKAQKLIENNLRQDWTIEEIIKRKELLENRVNYSQTGFDVEFNVKN